MTGEIVTQNLFIVHVHDFITLHVHRGLEIMFISLFLSHFNIIITDSIKSIKVDVISFLIININESER
jgi:hypothetical protein